MVEFVTQGGQRVQVHGFLKVVVQVERVVKKASGMLDFIGKGNAYKG